MLSAGETGGSFELSLAAVFVIEVKPCRSTQTIPSAVTTTTEI